MGANGVRETIRRNWLDVIIALGILAVALAVYNATLTPSLSYKSPDGNELATIPYTLGLAHSPGYPLYTWLGKLFTFIPIGDVAHRMNLMSAVLGAAGAALLYAIVRLITGNRPASAFAALLFAFSRTFWSQCVIAEVYAPNAFMLALSVWLLLKWAKGTEAFFLAFAFVYGLSLGTHLSNLAFAPAFALFVLLVDWRIVKRPWALLGGAAMFALGCLQFLWLPYKAATLNDPLMLRHAPTTLEGIYRYTLGAFPEFKFAFPLPAIPDRIVLYLHLLRQQFGLMGILLGLYGMWEMLFRDTRKFYLFITMYLAHVIFFVQYRAFDIDVFFVPAHLVYAIFIGYGACRLMGYIRELGRESKGRLWQTVLNAGVALLLCLTIVEEVRANWEANDCSRDTAIGDFYRNAFEMLPQGSVLIGRGGVFGYDMFYWRLVYNLRPDVIMPMLERPRPSPQELAGREVYTTQRFAPGGRRAGPWAPPPGLLDPDAWYVPILVGQSSPGVGRRELVLYRVNEEPPRLVVETAHPQHVVGKRLGGLELVGYDLDRLGVEPGGRFRLTLYWRVLRPERALVVTLLGEERLEAHELGFGNLQRYVREFHPPRDAIVVEDYFVVVPSQTPRGPQTLRVGLMEPLRPGKEDRAVLEAIELISIFVDS